jgi:hypothetical protein
MAEQPRPDDLAQLRAALAAQQIHVANLHADLARLQRRRRLPRRFLPLALVALLVALLPLALLAATPFNDLTGGVHDANIEAIYNAGITRGCDPNVSYCPTDLVTREEMASFLARTAGLGDNPPVANAATAQTVPDGSISTAKLSPAGSSAGQALVSTGGGVAWQAVAGVPGPPGPRGPSFGASEYSGSASLPRCVETVIGTLPVTVATPSHIDARTTGSYQPNGTASSFFNVRLRLRDQTNTTTLAITGTLEVVNVSSAYEGLPFATGGVLRGLGAPFYPGDEHPDAAPYVAPAGSYVLQVLAHTGGTCSSGAYVGGLELTALLLGTAP